MSAPTLSSTTENPSDPNKHQQGGDAGIIAEGAIARGKDTANILIDQINSGKSAE